MTNRRPREKLLLYWNLVSSPERRVLKRGNFRSVSDLKKKVRAFIDHFNKTMAKPFKWSYTGRPLNI